MSRTPCTKAVSLAASIVDDRMEALSNIYGFMEHDEDGNVFGELVDSYLEGEPFRFSDQLCAALTEIQAALNASPDSERLGRLFMDLEAYYNSRANAHAEAGFELGVEVGRRMAGARP